MPASTEPGAGTNTLDTNRARERLYHALRGRRRVRAGGRSLFSLSSEAHRAARTLKPWHLVILRGILYKQTIQQIADELGKPRHVVQNVMRTPAFKEALESVCSLVREECLAAATNTPVERAIMAEGLRSLDALIRLRDHSSDETVKVRAAATLLDRYEKLTTARKPDGSLLLPQATVDAITIAIKAVQVRACPNPPKSP